jgi:type VI secretion system secreted protein VgrG
MQNRSIVVLALLAFAPAAHAAATDVNLGSADSFAVLGASTVTNTGSTTIDGNVGVGPGSAVTGFPPGLVTNGTIHAADAVALAAHTSLGAAIVAASGQACGIDLTGQDLGGMTLTPGVYCFSSSAGLTGTLTLDSLGDAAAVFLFQIGSTLTTASASSVVMLGADQGDHLFWQVGSSATLGTTTAFAGNILAQESITMTTGATLQCGRALALVGAVTLDSNVIGINSAGCETTPIDGVPEPASWALLIVGFAMTGAGLRQRRRAAA